MCKSLTTLKPKEIYSLIKQFYKEHPPQKQKRGKPRKYPEELILLLLLLKITLNASYRKLLSIAQELYPDEQLPSLNDTFYRFKNLPEERLHQLLIWLYKKGIQIEEKDTKKELEEKGEEPYAMVDGTGVGYNTAFYLRNKRGQEIRKIRSHVKLVVFCYWQGGRNWVVDVEVGKAYSDEGKLCMELLEKRGEGLLAYGTNIVGDKLYGMRVDVLRKMESLG